MATAREALGSEYRKLFAANAISNLGDGVAIIAYPWLASAITRSGFLVALIVVVQRLPWLLFSLPAGVVTDRVDRRRLMVGANMVRAVIGLAVAVAVWTYRDTLPSPDDLTLVPVEGTNWVLYLILVGATMAMGTAEVLHDNTAQTMMPSVVKAKDLEKANGRMWAIEQVANTLIGPMLGAFLLVVAFTLPFGFDALTFALAAGLIALMSTQSRPNVDATPRPWKVELREGFAWLWNHDFLRPLAIILGFVNLLGTLTMSTLVLFGQEVLGTSATEFALMSTGGALGGVIAGWTADRVSARIGSGASLWIVILGGGVISIVTGLVSNWMVVWALFAVFMFTGVLWNVITVSLRQSIIPDELLGRVNSVYRFFAWGMMPVGALLAGLVILITERVGSRELALRMPWLIGGAGHFLLFIYAGPKLTTARIESARVSGTQR